jgi:MoxR-like ATPase
MNFDGRLQSSPIPASALTELCEMLAPDPSAPTKAPIPPGGSPVLEPDELVSLLQIAAADLVLEDGLLESLAAAISTGHVILTGPPGTAKSTLANLLAEVVKGDQWTPITATAEWTVHDVVGGYMPSLDGVLSFEPGLVLSALTEDHWLVIDELNRADIDKAFGELFTLLSDFPVTLPQRDPATGLRITISPFGGSGTYFVPEGWRMVGTMNTWDKTSLFRLSYAFMRRFSFIEIAVPPEDSYEDLISQFVAASGEFAEGTVKGLYTLFAGQSLRDMQLELGPGIARSVVSHLGAAVRAGLSEPDAFASALRARVVPQFEGAFERHEQIDAALRGACDTVGVAPVDVEALMRSLGSWTGGGATLV